ncbi:MAG: acylneuraminate cytidylyltransferase family protein [Myxococcales bacterium]|nr:acylneuraminate cytidylyltransferase family protein [Myxococcales bacterium]
MSRFLRVFLILKGESERVPGKNFRLLGDRPLYRWILDTVLALPETSELLIDTDVPERLTGLPVDPRLRVVRRRADLLGHDVTANALIAAHIDAGPEGALWLMVHATSPLLSAETLRGALAAWDARPPGRDSLFGVTAHHARFYDADGVAWNHDPARLVPTQALAPVYQENSTLYLFDRASFHAAGGRIGRAPVLFPTPALESLDIDTEADWALVHALAAARQAEDRP